MEFQKTELHQGLIKLEVGAEKLSDTVSGNVELDIENQGHFVNTLTSIFDETGGHIILDMKNITYIDSSGLWALFEGHKKGAQKNHKLILLAPTKDVKRVLDITKMSSKLDIFDKLDDAIKSVG